MAFNVSDFRGQVKDWLRPFSYKVFIKPPNDSIFGADQITLRTESVTLPGVAFLAVNNHRPYGSGLMLDYPYGATVQEINCIHTIDSNAEMIQRFYNWSNYIVNLDGSRKFTARYLDEIVAEMVINIYDLKGSVVKTYKMFDAFPLSVNQIAMSWATNDIVKLDVNYRFRNYIVE